MSNASLTVSSSCNEETSENISLGDGKKIQAIKVATPDVIYKTNMNPVVLFKRKLETLRKNNHRDITCKMYLS